MFRLICGGILCLCISYIGLGVKKYYSARKNYYIDMINFIELLTDEISFMKSPLPVIIENFTESKKGELPRVLSKYRELLTSGNPNEKQLRTAVRSNFLSKSENETVYSLLSKLGKLDSVTQLHNLSNYKSKFASKSVECSKKSDTLGVMAFKLGVLFGIMTMIMVA